MILSIKNRLIIPQLFTANRDSMTEATIQRSIRNATAIGSDEAALISLAQSPTGMIWDATKGADKEISFTPEQINYLKESAFAISKSGGVTQDLLPLLESIYVL